MRLYNTITYIGLSCLALLMTGCGSRMLTFEVGENIQSSAAKLDQVASQFPQQPPLVEIVDGQFLGIKKVTLPSALPV